VVAGDGSVSFAVVAVVAGDAPEDGFFDDGDFVLVGAGDAGGEGV